ncbi:MAG: TonB-dependent receptor domain-containing protein, partial [Flavipsychrobacter sp.]
SMNLVMKNAPNKLLVEGNVAVGYSTAFQSQDFQKYSTADVSKKSPAEILGPNVYAPVSMFPSSNLVTSNVKMPLNTNASVSLGNRFFKDKIGVIISGSYQNMYDGYNSNLFVENVVSAPSTDINTNNLPGFSDIEHRVYSMLSQRMGAIAKLDYKINDNNSISLFATHIQLNQYRVRNIIDSVPGGAHFNDTWVNVIGDKFKTETRTTLQSIDNITLQGTHKISSAFSADWSLVASEAKRQLPNDAEFSYATKDSLVTDPVTKQQSYRAAAPYFPYVTGQADEWQHNTDIDLAAYVNLHYRVNFIPFLKLIDIGGLYRDKNRDNYDNKYSLDQIIDLSGYQQYTSVQNAQLQFTVPSKAYGNAAGNAGIYTFKENLTAYYAQAHIEVGDLKLLGGVRIENTQQNYVSSLPVTIAGKEANYNYTDLLPSVQGKYDFNSKSGLRFSYFKSLYRPAYADLIPFPDQSSNEVYNTIGNPYLQHTVIHNADLRYELFPKGLDELMFGGFYKYIINPIEYAVVPQNKTDLILSPGNFGNATNYGIEIVGRKFFGSFGIAGSYTYTKSDINSDKMVYHKPASASDSFYTHVTQHRPLQGQAAHIGNVSLLYKNTKQKIEAQLGLVYTGERINTVSYYRDLDVWQKPTLNLDFSAQKQFGKHFVIYIKLKNILNTGSELFIKQPNTAYSAPNKLPYQESPDYYTVERDYYYSSFLIGLRYKLD